MTTASDEWRQAANLSVRQQVIDCTACDLHHRCTLPIPYSGKAPARIAVVVEAPNKIDDNLGKLHMPPLVKSSLQHAGVDLKTVALVPAVACWPSDDDMNWTHVEKCGTNLTIQLDEIDPTLVLLFGEVPLRALRPTLTIKFMRGHAWTAGKRTYFATFGPATAEKSDAALQSMQEDLETFVAMQQGVPFDGNDRCAACSTWAEWWNEDGLGFCPTHAGEPFNARARLLEQELAGARARVPA